MKTIAVKNGYINYTVEENEIIIDNIKVFEPRKGTGKDLINQIKHLSNQLCLPINLYAEPQDGTISEEDLKKFYYSCGFELDKDDTDGKLFTWI